MIKTNPLPPIDQLRRKLAYRSDGVLVWKRPRRKDLVGCPIGYPRNGYLVFQLRGKTFKVHRVIWALLKREDPLKFYIDHVNGNKLDNRIENLRKATAGQNQHNRVGAKGYGFNKKRKKFEVRLGLNHKSLFVGFFDTKEQAREAYLRAKEKLHGEFMPSDMKHELGQIDGPTSQLNLFND